MRKAMEIVLLAELEDTKRDMAEKVAIVDSDTNAVPSTDVADEEPVPEVRAGQAGNFHVEGQHDQKDDQPDNIEQPQRAERAPGTGYLQAAGHLMDRAAQIGTEIAPWGEERRRGQRCGWLGKCI